MLGTLLLDVALMERLDALDQPLDLQELEFSKESDRTLHASSVACDIAWFLFFSGLEGGADNRTSGNKKLPRCFSVCCLRGLDIILEALFEAFDFTLEQLLHEFDLVDAVESEFLFRLGFEA
mmetsp:Transcript_89367/g.141094  ORF Transcript_89367/g.141094 Transcript_89367/m.141094 type:complete len:122 (-) Transcript_89367:281-646(-)